jgi:hypothetical protein
MSATDPNAGANLANDASCFQTGDELLVVEFPSNGQTAVTCDNGSQFNYCIAVVTLSGNASVASGTIQLPYNATGAGSDPLGVIFNAQASGGRNYPKANGLGINYSVGAYIVDLGIGGNDVTYAVQPNSANTSDPQLVRCTGVTCTAANASVLTDQVIGFKVGAALWDNEATGASDIANFFYNAGNYCSDAIEISTSPVTYANCTATPPPADDGYDFTLVRSVRVSMIGRTPPSQDLALRNFKNTFDNGPYLVQQASVAVDLRNMSNNEFGN